MTDKEKLERALRAVGYLRVQRNEAYAGVCRYEGPSERAETLDEVVTLLERALNIDEAEQILSSEAYG